MQQHAIVDDKTVKKNITLNLERLRRQYAVLVQHYDEVSLMELSHTLRMWVDMRDSVQAYLAQHFPERGFKVYTVLPPLLKACHGSEYIVTYFVDGVKTYSAGSLVKFTNSLGGGSRMIFGWQPLSGGGMRAHHLLMLANSRITYEFDPATAFSTRQASFTRWLDGEAVRLAFRTADGRREERTISLTTLIKRVANQLGGSHPAGVFDVPHKFNPALDFLLDYKISGLPLPYYILLKAADTLLLGFEGVV